MYQIQLRLILKGQSVNIKNETVDVTVLGSEEVEVPL